MTFTDQLAQMANYPGKHRTDLPVAFDFDRDRPQGSPGRHRDDTLGAQLLDDALRMPPEALAATP